ncbi:hypothetical protein AAE478_001597 [Parahypoxylon ruwenzoriense]
MPTKKNGYKGHRPTPLPQLRTRASGDVLDNSPPPFSLSNGHDVDLERKINGSQAANAPEEGTHREYELMSTRNIVCDQCERRRRKGILRCKSCNMTICRGCSETGNYDARHIIPNMDLGDRIAVSSARETHEITQHQPDSPGTITSLREGSPAESSVAEGTNPPAVRSTGSSLDSPKPADQKGFAPRADADHSTTGTPTIVSHIPTIICDSVAGTRNNPNHSDRDTAGSPELEYGIGPGQQNARVRSGRKPLPSRRPANLTSTNPVSRVEPLNRRRSNKLTRAANRPFQPEVEEQVNKQVIVPQYEDYDIKRAQSTSYPKRRWPDLDGLGVDPPKEAKRTRYHDKESIEDEPQSGLSRPRDDVLHSPAGRRKLYRPSGLSRSGNKNEVLPLAGSKNMESSGPVHLGNFSEHPEDVLENPTRRVKPPYLPGTRREDLPNHLTIRPRLPGLLNSGNGDGLIPRTHYGDMDSISQGEEARDRSTSQLGPYSIMSNGENVNGVLSRHDHMSQHGEAQQVLQQQQEDELNRQWEFTSRLQYDWNNNPVVLQERRAKGPLAALDLLEASARMEAFRQGFPLQSFWSVWIEGVRLFFQQQR